MSEFYSPPPGSDGQPFHLDYATEIDKPVKTIFTAVTPSTSNNCTQVLGFSSNKIETDVRHLAITSGRPLETNEWQKPNISSLYVIPLLMKPWETIIVDTGSKFHRRSKNTSDYIRITFNIDVFLGIDSKFDSFSCIDTKRALETNRISPQKIIDNLAEQDIYLKESKYIKLPNFIPSNHIK